MDQQFLEREKELFKLNAKLNAKSKKIQTNATLKAAAAKPVQIHTANNYFNFYEEPAAPPTKAESNQESSFELRCKKITITNPPVKKTNEIVYPLFNRQTARVHRDENIHIHMPTGSLVSDGKEENEIIEEKPNDSKSEITMSFKEESLMTRYSDDSSAIPPANPIPHLALPLPPPLLNDIVPKSLEKKSNDGLLKFLKAKVALLQTELEAGKNMNDILEKENKNFLKKIKKLTVQNDKSTSRIDVLESSLKSLQDKNSADELSLKDKSAIISDLNKELIALREELKETSHNNQVLEKKVLKTQEDFEVMKSKFETFKDMEIIMRESSKDEKIAYEEKIRKLRKGRMDLLKAYKQQIILIDNLRRQNVCLEKAKTMEIAEKEFLKVLDWSFSEK